MTYLLSELHAFLKNNYKPKKPLLLAFSGGPDSLALLALLLKVKEEFQLDLHLAHIDHGWRINSAEEAQALQAKARRYSLPFHLKRLEMPVGVNLESYYRKERYKFFLELTKEYDCQATLLAHHLNDLEETVLKRVFEGANLESLHGMKKKSHYQTMTLWRPLLDFQKDELISFIKEENLSPILDVTNEDTKYLRARMRKVLIPSIEDHFGKNIRTNLGHLSTCSQRFQVYMEEKTKNKVLISKGVMGTCLDFSSESLHSFERCYLIRKLLKENGLVLHRSNLDLCDQWINEGLANKRIEHKDKTLFIDRKKIFILDVAFQELPKQKLALTTGSQYFGPWKVQVNICSEVKHHKVGFESFFETGHVFLQVPKSNDLYLKAADNQCFIPWKNKKLSELYSSMKIPNFVKPLTLIIQRKKENIAELFSDNNLLDNSPPFYNIDLVYKKD